MRALAVQWFTRLKTMEHEGHRDAPEAIRRAKLYVIEPETHGRVGDATAGFLADLVGQPWAPGDLVSGAGLPFDSLFLFAGASRAYHLTSDRGEVVAAVKQHAVCHGWLVWLEENRLNVTCWFFDGDRVASKRFCTQDHWRSDEQVKVMVGAFELSTILTLINTPSTVAEALYTPREQNAYKAATGKQLGKAFRIVSAPSVVTEKAARESGERVKASIERIAHSRRASQHLRIVTIESAEAVPRYERRGYRCYGWDQIPSEDRQEIARRGPKKCGRVPTQGFVGLKYYDVSAAEIGGRLDSAVPIRLVRP